MSFVSSRALLVSVVFGLAVVVSGCPAPPATSGEGEGEGEGEGVGEGEGEGEGSGPPLGTLIVPSVHMNLEDVAKDGSAIAYRDSNNTLFTVAPAGGASTQIVINTDKAEYHGNFLIALHGDVDGTGKVFATADQIPAGGSLAPLGTNVKQSSLDASADGLHLYFEQSLGGGLEDLFLDGVRILQGAKKEKERFTPSSAFLIVGANVPDATGTTTTKLVRVVPVDGSAPRTLIADGAGNETAVTHDSVDVITGDDEQGNLCAITLHAVDGSGQPVLLQAGGDHVRFKVTDDDVEVLYLTDTTVAGGAAIEAVTKDGITKRTVRQNGAVDLVALSSTFLVYASAINATDTSLVDLHIVNLDGTGDLPLGSDAVDEGFTSDGRFYLFRDGVNGGIGGLKSFDTTNGNITSLGDGIAKASKASATKVVFLDSLGVLRSATLGGDVVTVGTNVNHVSTIPDALGGDASTIAFSRSTDGLYVATIP